MNEHGQIARVVRVTSGVLRRAQPVRVLTGIALSVTFSLVVGCATAHSSEQPGILDKFLPLGLSPDSLHSKLKSATFFWRYDSGGTIRYADSLCGRACEIVPSFHNDSLTSLLFRFYLVATDPVGLVGECDTLFSGIERDIGRPPSIRDTRPCKIPELGKNRSEAWVLDGSVIVISFDRDELLYPQFDMLIMPSPVSEPSNLAHNSETPKEMDSLLSHLERIRVSVEPPRMFKRDLAAPSPDSTPAARSESGCEQEMPSCTRAATPVFPDAAEASGIAGEVWIKARVDREGKVVDVRIAKRSGTGVGYEEAAARAAFKNRYKPAKECGKPVAFWVTYSVHFRVVR